MSMTKRHIENLSETIRAEKPGLFDDAYDFLCDFGDESDIDGFMDYTENTTNDFEGFAALMAASTHMAREVA